MPQVGRAAIKARAAELRARGELALGAHLAGQQGKEVDILMERRDIGRTAQFVEVRVDRPQPIGSMVAATVRGMERQRLVAEVAQ